MGSWRTRLTRNLGIWDRYQLRNQGSIKGYVPPPESVHVKFVLVSISFAQRSVTQVKVKFVQLCPTLCDPEFSRPEYWSRQPFSSLGDLPNPGIKPRSPALWADPLPAESQGKPKNPGVGNLALLQGIFPTQGQNPGLLHCRRILYQLSHQRSPRILKWVAYPFSSGSSRSRNRAGVSQLQASYEGSPYVFTPSILEKKKSVQR